MSPSQRKVLLIGWDAADWKVINPLLDAGKMPHLESLIDGGTMGKLATLTPVLSPMLWTSIATGKRPYKHGIHGFAEPDLEKGGVRPITNLSRKTKALWNILSQEGLRSNVIGWWPSHPAEPINGVRVSNHFQQHRGQPEDDWPLMKDTVHPAELAEVLARFRVHPSELDAGQILPFVPKAARVDQKKDQRIGQVGKVLAECAGVHACATAVMQSEPWDFMGVYYDAIDHFCHAFMRYHPPKQEHIDQESFDLYQGVVESAYRFHDLMLGTLLKLAGEETTVILISDHGFHPDHLRPRNIPKEPNGPAVEHSPFGIFVAKGPGIKKDASVFGANLLDVTPTILSLFDLPVGEDMDGRILSEIFESPPVGKSISSWDEVEGDDGRHPPHFQCSPEDDRELMRQLVDLGYVEDPGDDKKAAEKRALRELQFNLARSYVDADRHAESVPILEKLIEDWPQELRFLNALAFSYLSINRLADTRRIAGRILEVQNEMGLEFAAMLPGVQKKFAECEDGEPDQELKNLSENLRRKAAAVTSSQHLLWGCLLAAEGDHDGALAVLKSIPGEQWTTPVLPLRIGHIYSSIGAVPEARDCFEQALKLDPQNARAYQELMQLSLQQHNFREAAEYGFASVGLLYFQPLAHHQIGRSLAGMRHYKEAAEAFQVAISQSPNFLEAHEHLAELYDRFLHRPEKAESHFRRASELAQLRAGKRKADKETVPREFHDQSVTERLEIPSDWEEGEIITIVSGLPRSGTSMVMQMLNAGGASCLTDEVREADQNNPRGYFELEGIKELHRDSRVLAEASGKAVKIVAPLIPRLPEGGRYRVIFIERNLDEVHSSQTAMLGRLGKDRSGLEADRMKNAYGRMIFRVNQFLTEKKIPTLSLNYAEVISSPSSAAQRMNSFCGGRLQEMAMAAAVDSTLHRERRSEGD